VTGVRYRAAGSFLLRAAALPMGPLVALLGAADPAAPWEEDYAREVLAIAEQPFVRAALAIASPHLADAVARATPGDRGRTGLGVGRYLNRMSSRATPFGLMAGVSGGTFAESGTSRLVAGGAIGAARARADSGWVLELARRSVDVRTPPDDLAVRANDLLHLARGRVWLAAADSYGSADNRVVTVRLTGPVRVVLELVRTPRTVGELRERLAAGFPTAPVDRIDRLLVELVELGVLVGAWRPALTPDDGADDGRDGDLLPPTADAATRRVRESVEGEIRAFNRTGSPDLAGALQERLRGSTPGFTGPVLQVDAALATDGPVVLPHAVAALAEDAAHILARIGTWQQYPRHLRDYAVALADRYGEEAEVPLLELLAVETGLGPPSGYLNPPRRYELESAVPEHDHGSQQMARTAVLVRLVATALARGETVVDLDDAMVDELAGRPDLLDDRRPAPVLDVQLQLVAPDDDHPGWRGVVCGSGVFLGGRTSARFHDLLDPPSRVALAELAAVEAAALSPALVVELSYLPLTGRAGNVATRPRLLDWEMPVNVAASVPAERTVPLGDVLVGVRDGRLRLRSARLGRELNVVQHTMLNTALAPNVCRFVIEISQAGTRLPASFDWGSLADSMPFLPRLTRGELVLSRARWQLRTADLPPLDHAGSKSPALVEAVRRWREGWRVPRLVHLTEADNTILLDLESAVSMAELRRALRKAASGQVLVEEALPAPEQGFLRDTAGGCYAAEVVVPVVLHGAVDGPPRSVPPVRAAGRVPGRSDRLRTVGSDWLFVKLYTEGEAIDGLVVDAVPAVAERLAARHGVGEPFLLRYGDPHPHLRLRFLVPDEGVRTAVLGEVAQWAHRLVDDGTLVDFCFASYSREIERYGGLEVIEHAEALFRRDSTVTTHLLRHLLEGKSALDRVGLVASGVERLSRLLLPDPADRRALAGVFDARIGGPEFRAAAGPLWEACTGTGADRVALDGAARLWAVPAAAFAERLAAAGAAGRLTSDPDRILLSLFHMHANRMGLGRHEEQVAYGLWRRLLDRLAHSPT
jgi:lantibiotic biosynthesis protein